MRKAVLLIVLLLLGLLFSGCLVPQAEETEQKTFEKHGLRMLYTVGNGWKEEPFASFIMGAIDPKSDAEVAFVLSKGETGQDISFVGVLLGDANAMQLSSLREIPKEMIVGQQVGGFGKVEDAFFKQIGSIEWLSISAADGNQKADLAIALCNEKIVVAVLTGKLEYMEANTGYFTQLLQSTECTPA